MLVGMVRRIVWVVRELHLYEDLPLDRWILGVSSAQREPLGEGRWSYRVHVGGEGNRDVPEKGNVAEPVVT